MLPNGLIEFLLTFEGGVSWASLKQISSIAYVSEFPAFGVVPIPAYIAILYYLAGKHLKASENKSHERLKFGLTLAEQICS